MLTAKKKTVGKKVAPRYERRVVLFLDFLGFKEHVARTVIDDSHLANIVSAMEIIGKIGHDDSKDLNRSQRITQFSDSVVVSFKVNEESGVFWLLMDILWCIVELLTKGFLVRGAVTVGDLLHTKSCLVGPAMVRAYELESKKANFPRVLIDATVVEVARQSRNPDHTPEQEEEYVRSMMKVDKDGLAFFDYVSWDAIVDVAGVDDERFAEYFEKLGRIIAGGLNSPDPRVQEKYLWLHKQYQNEIQRFSAMPQIHPYRSQSPEVCKAVENAKTLNRRARRARKRVKEYQKDLRQIQKS